MLVSRAGLSPVMVGRDSELDQLRRLLNDGSTPTIALIGGEPGIGKTRLASELASAVAPGTTVLLGQADPGGLAQPYQLLRDLAGDRREELAPPPADDPRDPMERARAALELLSALVANGPALVVADDLHLADPESLAILEQLDEVTTGPLLLVGTYRPEELTRRHPLAATLERLDRRRGVTHLRLQRLVPSDTAGFLSAVYGRSPSRRIVTALHNRTGGNPFFLEELLKAAGDTELDQIHTLPLPWNLAEALRSQLDGLTPEQRQVVEAAAVLGARVSFDLLATVTGFDESALIAGLRDLVDRGLLTEAEDDQFGFRHTLTREAVAGELLARQRRRLHEVALEALLAVDPPDLAAVAVQARGAGRYQDMVDAARRGAGQRLAAGSAYAALTLAELGLEESPDDTELLATAATAAWRAGYLADSRRHATRALRAATDDEQRAEALTRLIRVAWEHRDVTEMDGYTEQVRALTRALPDSEVRALAMAAVAQAGMLRGRHDEALEWAEHACEAAERHGAKQVRLSALVEKGSVLVSRPDTQAEGRRLLTEVGAEAEHADAPFEAARAWHNLFWFQSPSDPTAPEVLERMRANAERAGVAGISVAAYHGGRAWLAFAQGDLEGAIAVLNDIRRTDQNSTAIDDVAGVPITLDERLSTRSGHRRRLVELYLERGELDRAETLLAEAPPSPGWQEVATGLAFQLACHRGDLAAARALLPELTSVLDGSTLASAATLHGHLSAGLAAGLAAELLRPLADRDTGHKNRPDRPDHPLRVLIAAQLAEAQRRYGEALAGYERAATPIEPGTCAGHDPAVCPAYRGTAAVGAARCLVQLGRRDEADPHLAAARTHLARWHGWRRAELAAVARRLGAVEHLAGGRSEHPGGGVSELTAREREVAALLADGLTNSEISRRMVISRKTVAVHVSHILAKLEMTSRTQVAAWVARSQPPSA